MELVLIAAFFFAMPVVVNTDVNVVVAPPYELAHFECEARGDFLVWLVNTVALNDSVKEEREIVVTDTSSNGTQHSNLTITALPKNNGIDIGCIVGDAPYNVTFFNEKTLEVRGISPVEDLMLNFTSSNSLIISWSPPDYFSDGVRRENILYDVSVIYEEDAFILSVENNTLVEVSNVTECDTFNVSVTALWKNYQSATRFKGNEGSYSINLDRKCSTKQAVFQLEFLPLGCPSLVSVDIEPSNGNRSVFMKHTNWGMKHFNCTLLPFEHYKVVLRVKNLKQQVKSELVINISTYHVNNTDLEQYSNGSVVVSCQYCVPVAESTGEGCYVMFNNSAGEVEETLNITGSNEEIVTFKESGNYTVTTYDLVNGSIKGPAIAPEQIEVTIDDIDPPTDSPTDENPNIGVIVGIGIGILVTIFLVAVTIVLIVIYYCKKMRGSKNFQNGILSTIHANAKNADDG